MSTTRDAEAAALPCRARIVGDCRTLLWSLTSRERLARQLRNAGVTELLDEAETVDGPATVLLLRADRLFDDRTIRDLVGRAGVLLEAEHDGNAAVAAHVAAERAAVAERVLLGEAAATEMPEVEVTTPARLSSSYVGQLLKSAPPAVLAIRPERQRALERHLFEGSYKGVTDLVTKWVWPAPARRTTRLLVRYGIRPNGITAASLGLVLLATYLFAIGWYGTGLLAAWLMTFLDTVDGKLARVTVDSSTFGHLLDHGIDLVHPPFWYIAWGYGLAAYGDPIRPPELNALLTAIVAGYVVGRIAEGLFDFWLARFSMFSWRPVDSYFRLIMARRNPNLLLLTLGALTARPALGLVAVGAWTVASSVFLVLRLLLAVRRRLAGEPLKPWLEEVGHGADVDWIARPFVRRPPGDWSAAP